MLLLASKSPRRRAILQSMGIEFDVVDPDAEEFSRGVYFEDIPVLNAVLKAGKVAGDNPDIPVLGADTVVELDGRHYNKPIDAEDAVRMLQSLSGREHLVVTAVCIQWRSKNIFAVFADKSFVRFKSFGLDSIHKYMSQVDVMDKAGAYAVQEEGGLIIKGISGSVSNVMGLPREKLAEALAVIHPK